MRNLWILLGYLTLFLAVVTSYESFKDSIFLSVTAASVLMITGLLAWLWSVQPKRGEE